MTCLPTSSDDFREAPNDSTVSVEQIPTITEHGQHPTNVVASEDVVNPVVSTCIYVTRYYDLYLGSIAGPPSLCRLKKRAPDLGRLRSLHPGNRQWLVSLSPGKLRRQEQGLPLKGFNHTAYQGGCRGPSLQVWFLVLKPLPYIFSIVVISYFF